MEVIQKEFKVDSINYYKTHLNILCSVLPVKLSDKEVEVLANFMSLDKELTKDDMFNTEARRRVKEKSDLSSGGLANHLKSMITKGFVTKDEFTHRLTVREFLIPEDTTQGYQFKLIKQ